MQLPHSPFWLLLPCGLCLVTVLLLRRRQQHLRTRGLGRLSDEVIRLAAALADGTLNPQQLASALQTTYVALRTRLRGAERELLELSLALAGTPGVDPQELVARLGTTLRSRLSAARALETAARRQFRRTAWCALPPLLLSVTLLAWLARATPWLLQSTPGLSLLATLAGLQALGGLLLWRELGRIACHGRC